MIPKTNWEPSEQDVAWQRAFLRAMAPAAVWGVPASQSAFQFNKSRKTFCLINGDPAHELNRRIAKVLQQLGYNEVTTTTSTEIDDDDSDF